MYKGTQYTAYSI